MLLAGESSAISVKVIPLLFARALYAGETAKIKIRIATMANKTLNHGPAAYTECWTFDFVFTSFFSSGSTKAPGRITNSNTPVLFIFNPCVFAIIPWPNSWTTTTMNKEIIPYQNGTKICEPVILLIKNNQPNNYSIFRIYIIIINLFIFKIFEWQK